jgi:hypothetical protein
LQCQISENSKYMVFIVWNVQLWLFCEDWIVESIHHKAQTGTKIKLYQSQLFCLIILEKAHILRSSKPMLLQRFTSAGPI